MSDGRLASGSYDATIGLWNVATGAETARLEGNDGSVQALIVLADGRKTTRSGYQISVVAHIRAFGTRCAR